MTPQRLEIEQALPHMQALASELWTTAARHHPGQLAWSAAYGEPEALDLGPVFVTDGAWAWLESPGWLEVCGADPEAVRAVVAAALEECWFAGAGEVTTSTETDHVVVAPDGEWVASCCVWVDEATGVALVEPVGCVAAHERRGLATAASVSALTAARDLGASTGLVCPRGDDDYPAPARLYRKIGFEPGPRTRAYRLRPGSR